MTSAKGLSDFLDSPVFVVGMRRLELPTSTSRTWRASQLCYIPIFMSCNRFGSTVLDYGCKGTTLF